jgi:hypothetical protein
MGSNRGGLFLNHSVLGLNQTPNSHWIVCVKHVIKRRFVTQYALSKTNMLITFQQVNILGKKPDGCFVLIVDTDIGWISVKHSKELDKDTKDLNIAKSLANVIRKTSYVVVATVVL